MFRVEGLSVLDYFDGMILSFQEKVCKPAPAIFEILLRRHSLEPEKTLFLDDSQKNCEAARRCGINALLVPEDTEFTELLGL